MARAGAFSVDASKYGHFDALEYPLGWICDEEIADNTNAVTLADAIAGSASLGDSLRVARALLCSTNGTGIVADSVSIKRALIATVLGASSVTDALRVLRSFQDGFQGSSLVTESVTSTRALKLVGAGAAALLESIRVSRMLNDTISAHALVVDAISVARTLNESIVGSASAVEALSVVRHFLEAIAGHSSATLALSFARLFADAISGQATVIDAVRVARSLTEGIGGNASVTDSLRVLRVLLDAIVASASVTDSLRANRAVTTPIVGASSATANARVARALQDHIVAVSSLTELLSVGRMLFLALDNQSTANVSFLESVHRSIADSMHGNAAVTDSLSAVRGSRMSVQSSASLLAQASLLRALQSNVVGFSSVAEMFSRFVSYTDLDLVGRAFMFGKISGPPTPPPSTFALNIAGRTFATMMMTATPPVTVSLATRIQGQAFMYSRFAKLITRFFSTHVAGRSSFSVTQFNAYSGVTLSLINGPGKAVCRVWKISGDWIEPFGDSFTLNVGAEFEIVFYEPVQRRGPQRTSLLYPFESIIPIDSKYFVKVQSGEVGRYVFTCY